MRFSIKRRVCFRNAVLLGFDAIVVFRLVEPVVEMTIAEIPEQIRLFIVVLFGIVFTVDMVVSARRAWSYRNQLEGGELKLIFKAHR